MNPKHALLDLKYFQLFRQCTSLEPFEESTVQYLVNAYQAMRSAVGLSASDSHVCSQTDYLQ